MSSGIRKPKRNAVFISGGGSTLQALLEMHHQFEIGLIVTNKRNLLGELKAKRFGKDVFFFSKKTSYSELTILLKKYKIDQIFLAGFMRLLPEDFVQTWKDRIFNIHPSLLPAFPGLDSIEKNYHAKLDMGVTIHVVNEHMDEGQIFLQQQSLDEAATKKLSLVQSQAFIRRTEQHLLREFALRRAL